MYHLTTKTHQKRVEEIANVIFLSHRLIAHYFTVVNLRRSTSQTPLVMLEWIEFGCVHKLYPEESDCVGRNLYPKRCDSSPVV